ncbi:MAG: flagellar FlbD family protein [Bacillota bacterium]|nr:flagellar FlbD family protein [Bacillota bacterium]
MIYLNRLDGRQFILNAQHIETVEATPDTVVTLTNGHKYVVRETVEQVLEAVMAYHRRLGAGVPVRVVPRAGPEGKGPEESGDEGVR